MSANDLPPILAGEPHAFHPGDIDEGPLPQRIPGATLGVDAVAEAEVQRAARRIESEGDR